MLYRSAKRRLRLWRVRTELKLAKRERVKIARAMGKLIIKRARFLRWARLVITQRKMLRACHRFDNKFKRYGDGLGHLRYGWYRWKSRLFLQRWEDETKGQARLEYALKWQAAKFKVRIWKAFKSYIKQCIIEKNKELDMADRRKWLVDMMNDADAELAELKKKKEEEMLRKKIEEEVRAKLCWLIYCAFFSFFLSCASRELTPPNLDPDRNRNACAARAGGGSEGKN